jgi:DNA modification methylase
MIKKIKISELKKYPRNPRKMDKSIYLQLVHSIREFGDSEVLVVNKNNEVIGGNHRLDAFIEVFGPDYEADCKVVDLPKNKEIKLNIALNGISGEFNTEMLKEIFFELNEANEELTNLGFNEDEIMIITEGLIEPIETIEKEINPIISKYSFNSGDIIILGKHKLICGDCENCLKDLMNGEKASMILTDPPYGVDYGNKNKWLNEYDKGNRIQEVYANDEVKKDHKTFFQNTIFKAKDYLTDYNQIYVFIGPTILELLEAMKSENVKMGMILVWVKNNHVLAMTDYMPKHEFIVYGWYGKHKFYGDHRQSVFEYDKPLKNDLHPTMKPVELLKDIISHGSQENEIVLDMFGGSGSTLIACEETNRRCFMSEIDSHYCSVIVERWENLTGKQHSKL